jgi:hypothetical protein
MYKILDTKLNREFKPELIGYSFEGSLSGEYVQLQVKDQVVTILLNEVEILEGENLINKSMLTDSCKYEAVAESNKGYRVLFGSEYIKSFDGSYNNRLMHVVIYNFNTKEVVYTSGNNLRLEYDEFVEYVQCNLTQWIDENIQDSYKFNTILNKILYNCDRNILRDIKKDQLNRFIKAYELEKENKLKAENEILETELIKVAEDKNIFLIDGYTTLYVLNFEDKKVFNHYNNKEGKKFLYDILMSPEKDDNKDIYKLLVDKAGMYIFAEYDHNYGVKGHNENLKDAIAYMTNNINVSVAKIVNSSIDSIDKDIKNKIKFSVINYFVKDKNIKNKFLIDEEIKYIIDISKQIRSELQYKNGVYYPIIELFQDVQLKDDYYKYFVMDALKLLDIEYYNNNELYRVCS